MNVLAGNSYKLIINGSKNILYNFFEDIDSNTIEGHLVWDARSFSLEKKEEIKSKIEECCLIVQIDVIDSNPSIVPWLEDIFVNKFTFHLCGDYPISLPSFKVVNDDAPSTSPTIVSNVCWIPKYDIQMWTWLKSLQIYEINIALSMYGDINVHFVKRLRNMLDKNGMTVNSINAIFFNRRENFNEDYGMYIIHFRKMIEYAKILGAKYIIYGSTSSKFINTCEFESYVNKQKARAYFICALNTICEIANQYNIQIIIKSNTESNFMNTNEEVYDLVEEIKKDNLHMGNNRSQPIVSHKFFDLIEFNGNALFNSIESIKQYISHLFFCKLSGSSLEEKKSE